MTLSLYTAESLNLPCLIHFNGQKGSKEPTISRDFKGFMGVEKSWLLSDRDLNMIIVFFMRKHERKNKAAGNRHRRLFPDHAPFTFASFALSEGLEQAK